MTETEQAALSKWAAVGDYRAQIEDFIDWIVKEKGVEVWLPAGDTVTDLLDEFYGIGQNGLKLTRREVANGQHD